jgi:hypothetical protein
MNDVHVRLLLDCDTLGSRTQCETQHYRRHREPHSHIALEMQVLEFLNRARSYPMRLGDRSV